MQYLDGMAAGVALSGFLWALVSYARNRERDTLIIGVVCAVALTGATVGAFAPHAVWVLSPLIWAAVAAAVVVIRRERRRQH